MLLLHAALLTAKEANAGENDTIYSAAIKTLPGFLWVILAGVASFVFRAEAKAALREIVWRIKAGSSFKLKWIEVGSSSYVTPRSQERSAGIKIRPDKDREFANQREPFKTRFRNLFVVHRLAPSRDLTALYDVEIYLIPSLHYGSLKGVSSVDYYFGTYWESKIFTSNNRGDGFAISTSAWAPFTCTAKVNFTDGEHVFLHRLIDFEMGPIGNTPQNRDALNGET
jgi:hypothetical protein